MKGKEKMVAFKQWQEKYNFQDEDDIKDDGVENPGAGQEQQGADHDHDHELVSRETSSTVENNNEENLGEEVVRMFKELPIETQEEVIKEVLKLVEGLPSMDKQLPNESDEDYRVRCLVEVHKKLPFGLVVIWSSIVGVPPMERSILVGRRDRKVISQRINNKNDQLKNEFIKVNTFDLRGGGQGESQHGQGSSSKSH